MRMDSPGDKDSGCSREGGDDFFTREDSKEERRSTRRSNQRRHTHNSRAKLNMKFDELSRFIAPNMFQSSSSTSAKAHKSKIIGDAIQMYTRLMKQKEVLEAEIAFSSAEKLNEWVNKTVMRNPDELHIVLENVVKMFCLKHEWVYGEVWCPKEVNGQLKMCLSSHTINPTYDNDLRAILERYHARTGEMQYAPPQSAPGRAYQTLRTEWLPDLSDALVFFPSEAAADAGLQTVCTIPVKNQPPQVSAVAALLFYSRERIGYDASKMGLVEDVLQAVITAFKAPRGREETPP